MFCQSCGKERRPNSNYCAYCGAKQIQKRKLSTFTIVVLTLLLVSSIGLSIFIVSAFYSGLPSSLASNVEIKQHEVKKTPEAIKTTTPIAEKQPLKEEQKTDLTEIIAAAQQTVYTVFTPYSQGSGFLFDSNGAVVTNAHVVEGETNVFIKTVHGVEYPGTVIGISNETDVAVIYVPDLIGEEPFALDFTDSTMIGEEIIALGSPLGLENTATMGYITGKNRNFIISPYIYENLYQISAPISPGSSGGPLISKKSEKIIAINSAESIEDAMIGFSIPLYTVHSLIQSWINEPMDEEEVLAQYYGEFNDSSWNEGYFDGGEYSDDEDYHYYWEYGYEDFWTEFGDALWEYFELEDSYYEDWYVEEESSNGEPSEDDWSNDDTDIHTEDGYVDPSTDPNMYYNEETGQWSYYDEVNDLWYYYDNYLETWTYYDEFEGLWYYYDEMVDDYLPF